MFAISCEQLRCAAECRPGAAEDATGAPLDCGWSSEQGVCVVGAFTNPFEAAEAGCVGAVPAKSCAELGYQTRAGNADVCGTSRPDGACATSASYVDALHTCLDRGARLCTVAEIEADATRGTGCGFDRAYVWSASLCRGGVYVAAGSSRFSAQLPEACVAGRDGDAHAIRCCADREVR